MPFIALYVIALHHFMIRIDMLCLPDNIPADISLLWMDAMSYNDLVEDDMDIVLIENLIFIALCID